MNERRRYNMPVKQNVTEWLDTLKFNRFHGILIMLGGLALIFDGYDFQIVAYIMPQVIKEWTLSPVLAGQIAAYSFAGLMLGATGLGMLADRIGRKRGLMLCLIIFTAFNGAAAFAHNFKIFCLLRFLSGVGMGGCQPIALTLITEFLPSKIRVKSIAVLFAGFTGGWALAGAVSMAIIPAFGWRVALFMGFVPIFFIPFVILYLPESVRFLAGKKRFEEAVREIRRVEKAARVAPMDWSPANFSIVRSVTRPNSKFTDIFKGGLARMTVLMWASYFFSLFIANCLGVWLPSLMVKAGFSLVKSYSYGLIQAVGACFGGFVVGWFMDRFGRKAGLCTAFGLGGFAVWVFGLVTNNMALYAAGFVAGALLIGGQNALQAVVGEVYPTHVRGTGAGAAMTIGRLGAITASMVGGVLVGFFSFSQYFFVISVPCFLMVGIVLLYRVDKGEALEAIQERLAGIAATSDLPENAKVGRETPLPTSK
jgi:AAHS family benzoate transporter-like MFS transporter